MRIHIKMTIWNKASFGVFDFTPNNQFVSVIHYIADRNGHFLLDFPRESVFELNGDQIKEDLSGNKKFSLNLEDLTLNDFGESMKLSESLWIPLSKHDNPFLKVGDVIRFGKQQLVVNSLYFDLKKPLSEFTLKGETILEQNNKMKAEVVFEKDSVCRICLESNSKLNPFVDICNCSKNMPMHLSCVREWMKRKCEVSDSIRSQLE